MARPRNDVSYNVADVDGIIGKYCLSTPHEMPSQLRMKI